MSNLTQELQRLGQAIEEARRSFGALVTEFQIVEGAQKNARQEIEEGLARETQLREILRDKGLASFESEPGRLSNDSSNT